MLLLWVFYNFTFFMLVACSHREQVYSLETEIMISADWSRSGLNEKEQDYGATNGVDRAGQLTADIAAWQARFGDTVTLWYGYSLAEVTGSSSQLGAPAAQLGVKNLLVKVPSSSTLDAAAREELTLSLTEAGVEHVVIRDDAASYFE